MGQKSRPLSYVLSAKECSCYDSSFSQAQIRASKIVLKKCTMRGNTYIEGNYITIKNSNFKANMASEDMIYARKKVTVDRCTFSNIKKNDVNLIRSKGVCKISNSKFTNNFYKRKGVNGFLWDACIIEADGKCEISKCKFSGNSRVVESNGGKLIIKNSQFTGNKQFKTFSWAIVANTKGGCEISGCTFKSNRGTESGAVYSHGKTTIKNTRFISNLGKDAGAVKIDNSKMTLSKCKFKKNVRNAVYGLCSKVTVKKGSKSVKYSSKEIPLDNKLKKVKLLYVTVPVQIFRYHSNEPLKVKIQKYNWYYWNGWQDCKNHKVKISIADGKKTKNYYAKTNSKGIASFRFVSKLKAGTYKICIESKDKNKANFYPLDKEIDILRISLVAKTSKSKNTYKIKVFKKSSGKPVKRLKVKLKFTSSKKSKTYTVRTDKNGIAKFNIKKLTKGKYKLHISSGNGNYRLSLNRKLSKT